MAVARNPAGPQQPSGSNAAVTSLTLADRSIGKLEGIPEKERLILSAESNLKPNTTVSLDNRHKRDRVDIVMIQPYADLVHSLSKRTFRLLFDAHDDGGIERHVALLSLPVRRERLLVSRLVPRLWLGAPMIYDAA
jgi:hypothetical protein